jgi:hypothetical protein
MAALDIIASELLKSANEADLIYKKTRDQAQKSKAVRLRRIVENLRQVVLGASEINELTDVTITAVSNGQVLTYNSTSNKWENQTPSSGGALFQIDYDYNIVGIKDNINTNFNTTLNFVTNTTRVYLNGQRLTRGVGYDYVEAGTTQITFALAPAPTDQLIIEYQI